MYYNNKEKVASPHRDGGQGGGASYRNCGTPQTKTFSYT
jgi:hypothetical protein